MHWICPSLKIKENQTPWGAQDLLRKTILGQAYKVEFISRSRFQCRIPRGVIMYPTQAAVDPE